MIPDSVRNVDAALDHIGMIGRVVPARSLGDGLLADCPCDSERTATRIRLGKVPRSAISATQSAFGTSAATQATKVAPFAHCDSVIRRQMVSSDPCDASRRATAPASPREIDYLRHSDHDAPVHSGAPANLQECALEDRLSMLIVETSDRERGPSQHAAVPGLRPSRTASSPRHERLDEPISSTPVPHSLPSEAAMIATSRYSTRPRSQSLSQFEVTGEQTMRRSTPLTWK